jgi:carbon starvation protein CstA
VCAARICLAQHVEQEEVHIIVQRLVVQEQLGQVAQVLAVLLLLAAINLTAGDTQKQAARFVLSDLECMVAAAA